jgi:replicative DNA helicase
MRHGSGKAVGDHCIELLLLSVALAWLFADLPSPLSTGAFLVGPLEAGLGGAHQGRMATDLLARPASETASAGRALPANLEAEAAFLGAVLIDNRVLEELTVPIRPEHFFEPLHTRILERIAVLLDKQMVVTPVTLKPYFESDPAMAELGGTAYLAHLTADGQGLLAPRELAQQIYDLALLRELVSVGRELVEHALDTSEDVEPMRQIEQAEAALFRVAEGAGGGNEAQSFRGATGKALEMIETAINSGGHVSGRTTGFTSVNDKCGGLHDSDLIILAGRPGMGKTSLATNIAFNCADRMLRDKRDGIEKSVGAGVAFFSLEMSSDQLATRILAEQAGIPSEALRMGKISRDDFQQLSYASQRLAELPLYIDDTPALSIAALRTRARRLKRKHDIGLIVVDYLQLLQGSQRSQDNRVNEISEISRGLKTLAKELQVPVIALSQLSRAVEQREDKRPMLSDLRESGSIEQDADMVWFVFREDYYVAAREPKVPMGDDDMKAHEAHAAWQAEMERVYGLAELIVAKQRHGSTGKVRLRFEPKITRFSDLAEGEYPGGYD